MQGHRGTCRVQVRRPDALRGHVVAVNFVFGLLNLWFHAFLLLDVMQRQHLCLIRCASRLPFVVHLLVGRRSDDVAASCTCVCVYARVYARVYVCMYVAK